MTNRPLLIRKYHSARLKEFQYCIENSFEESQKLSEIIGISDNQILRSIRDIRRRTIKKERVELLIQMRDYYQRQITYQQSSQGLLLASLIAEKLKHVKTRNHFTKRLWNKYVHITVYSDEAKRLQDKLNRTMFHPDYVTVVMDTAKQYDELYHNGFFINGHRYARLSCSAGQARVSTVIFGNEAILPELKRRLDNGRNKNKPLSPSKFNAYFGLYSSATKPVSEPSFLVVKDCINTASFSASYVLENGPKVDDTIVEKELCGIPMNRTDGMGLISYSRAKKWADELGLDYVPAQFCIRQSFLKGMLCVFPIHEFCEKVNGGNYMVDTIYQDENGKPIQADLREYDVIISESQFKLWDSYDSIDSYRENCRKNHLQWGISLVSPKEAKHMLKLNYQFIQTLRLSEEDIKELAQPFVDWISKVSYDNVYYMLLFLLGVNNDTEKISHFLSGSDAYWIKALIADHSVKNDKYIRTKIRELLKHKIENGCKGDIYTDGNFQVIVSDPYGFMQHVCGLPVTGLLKPGNSYSHYWNEKNVKQVDAMRSPLTYLSEHVILNLQKDDETEYWFRHCNLGIILNYHGHETFHFAGSDFDMDILATTPNPVMLKGIYQNELPVVYDVPKPQKILFTEDDLYQADTFSFGSIIGSITNKSSNGYALLPLIEQRFGIHSPEYHLLKSRLQQCCKAQSAQIDKAKIGREVKGIPKVWITRNRLKKNKNGQIIDKHAIRKQLYNNTLLDKYPYFFRYIYPETNRNYKKYRNEYDIICRQKYCMDFQQLENLEQKTPEQEQLIARFYEFCPVLISNSPMNLLCQYLEGINFRISKKIKSDSLKFDFQIYKRAELPYQEFYHPVIAAFQDFLKEEQGILLTNCTNAEEEESNSNKLHKNDRIARLHESMRKIHSNPYFITNCLVDYFYQEKSGTNPALLWMAYGKYIYRNITANMKRTTALFPMPCGDYEEPDLQYLGYNYKLQEVEL